MTFYPDYRALDALEFPARDVRQDDLMDELPSARRVHALRRRPRPAGPSPDRHPNPNERSSR